MSICVELQTRIFKKKKQIKIMYSRTLPEPCRYLEYAFENVHTAPCPRCTGGTPTTTRATALWFRTRGLARIVIIIMYADARRCHIAHYNAATRCNNMVINNKYIIVLTDNIYLILLYYRIFFLNFFLFLR